MRSATTTFFDRKEKGEEKAYIRHEEKAMRDRLKLESTKEEHEHLVNELKLIVGPSLFSQIPAKTVERIIAWKQDHGLTYEDV